MSKYEQMSQGSGEYIPLGRVPVPKVWICHVFSLSVKDAILSNKKHLDWDGSSPISNMDLPKGTLEMLHEKPSSQLSTLPGAKWHPDLLVRLYGSRDP